MFSKILVALDGSPRAPDVLATAMTMAARFGAELFPMRAIYIPPDFPPAGAHAPEDPLPKQLRSEAEAELTRLLTSATNGAKIAPPILRLTRQAPWHAILEVAAELPADMIVLGSHGYHAIDHVLGTTAAKVSNRAKCSVFVVQGAHPPR